MTIHRSRLIVLVCAVLAACAAPSPGVDGIGGDGTAATDAQDVGIDRVTNADVEAGFADTTVPDAAPPADAGVTIRTYTPSDETFLNPERGYFASASIDGTSGPGPLRAMGFSLGYAYVILPMTPTLDPAYVARLGAGLDRIRAAGLEVILRFAYNRTDGGPDMPLPVILRHIADLTPMVRAHADVIALLHAGLIGPYGEWHHFGTTDVNMLDNDAAHRAILEAELAMMPVDRAVAVRTPRYKQSLYGGPLAESAAFMATPLARLAHHNDCFLSDATDQGTYTGGGMTAAGWRAFLAQETAFVSMGGETCPGPGGGLPGRIDCPMALADMTSMHWSYLNSEWAPGIRMYWSDHGCGVEIDRRLGYRLSFARAAYTSRVAPGGVLSLTLAVNNSGFAAPFNLRHARIVLDGCGTRRVATLAGVDARRWAAGRDTEFNARLRVPASTPTGTCRLALWLPSEAVALQSRPEYSIRLANAGVWNFTFGDNTIGTDLQIDPAAPGPTDPLATEFVEIP